MKIKPRGAIVGVEIPAALALGRLRVPRAVEEDDALTLCEHFEAWRDWAVRAENASGSGGGSRGSRFDWTCGSSPCPRFETACLAYSCGRALFHARRYALAYAKFGLALEETMQCRDPLPLATSACAAFRLRCLVRAQRLAVCELDPKVDGARMLLLANWLAAAAIAYGTFPGASSKEPLAAGASLAAAARAIVGRAAPGDRALVDAWPMNPFRDDAPDSPPIRRDAGEPASGDRDAGEFAWERFVGDRSFSG